MWGHDRRREADIPSVASFSPVHVCQSYSNQAANDAVQGSRWAGEIITKY
jgi:hypothetical protein